MYNRKIIKRKRLRIVNKWRFITFVTVLILALSILASGVIRIDKAYSTTYQKWNEIVVKKGDTLWTIARNNNPENFDTRKVVYEIMKFNNMKTATIKPGEVIRIPIN